MRAFIAICLFAFSATHFWAAYTTEKLPDAHTLPGRLFGISMATWIHVLSGMLLLLVGLVFWFARVP